MSAQPWISCEATTAWDLLRHQALDLITSEVCISAKCVSRTWLTCVAIMAAAYLAHLNEAR